MVRFEIRYRMPHGVGSRIVRHNDRYDAEAEGQERYGDAFIEAVEYVNPHASDHPITLLSFCAAASTATTARESIPRAGGRDPA